MRSEVFGKSGKSVPVIGQGSWNFSLDKAERAELVQALCLGVEHGMTHIDTAEMYGDGGSEEIIGEAIKNFKREDLFLVSKVLPSNASYKGTISACERSLKRLGTDYLDCYLLHWRGSVPLSETIKAFEELIDSGKVRAMGVSNFDVLDMEEALQLAHKPIVCNQILYNLQTRAPEKQLMPFCKQRGIAVVSYTPFAQQKLPGRGTTAGDTLHEIADIHGATVSQVILAFLVRDTNVFTIPKAASKEHVLDNAKAGDLHLSEEEIEAISTAYPAPRRSVPLQTL